MPIRTKAQSGLRLTWQCPCPISPAMSMDPAGSGGHGRGPWFAPHKAANVRLNLWPPALARHWPGIGPALDAIIASLALENAQRPENTRQRQGGELRLLREIRCVSVAQTLQKSLEGLAATGPRPVRARCRRPDTGRNERVDPVSPVQTSASACGFEQISGSTFTVRDATPAP
jgi:hypothetical protein